MLKYNSTLPAAHRFTASRIIGLHRGLFVVSYKRNTRVRLHHSQLGFSHLGRVFVSRLRNSRYFNLLKLVSAFKLLNEATSLRVRSPRKLRRLFTPVLTFFYGALACGMLFRRFRAGRPTLVCSSHSIAMAAVPLGRHVPYYKFLFRRGRHPGRVVESVISFCGIPICRLGQVGGKTSFIAPRKRIVTGSHLAHPSTPTEGCTCYSSAVCLPGVTKRVGKMSLLFRRSAFTRARRTHTGRACRAATTRTTRLTLSTRIGRLIVKRFSTHCRSRSMLLGRTTTVFPRAVLTGRGLYVSISKKATRRGWGASVKCNSEVSDLSNDLWGETTSVSSAQFSNFLTRIIRSHLSGRCKRRAPSSSLVSKQRWANCSLKLNSDDLLSKRE